LSEPAKFNLRGANIGNLAETVQGNQIAHQHISATEQNFEILLTNYTHFINELQQKYSGLSDATTVSQIIEVEAKLIEAQDQQRW
jgi:hypothetical protein